MEESTGFEFLALFFFIVVVGVPSYYFGKTVQRDENLVNCVQHGKVEVGIREWRQCIPIAGK